MQLFIDLDSRRFVRDTGCSVGLRSVDFLEGQTYTGNLSVIQDGEFVSPESTALSIRNKTNQLFYCGTLATGSNYSLTVDSLALRNDVIPQENLSAIFGATVTFNSQSFVINPIPAQVIYNPNIDNLPIAADVVYLIGNDNSASGQTINVIGGESTVSGQNISVSGRCSKVYGDNSSVHGDLARVYGDNNKITGQNISVTGNQNGITGQTVSVYGNNNSVNMTSGQIFNNGDLSLSVYGSSVPVSATGEIVINSESGSYINGTFYNSLISGDDFLIQYSSFYNPTGQTFNITNGVNGSTFINGLTGQNINVSGGVNTITATVSAINGGTTYVSGNVSAISGGTNILSGSSKVTASFWLDEVYTGNFQQEFFVQDSLNLTGYCIGAITSGLAGTVTGAFYQRSTGNLTGLICPYSFNSGQVYRAQAIPAVTITGGNRIGFSVYSPSTGVSGMAGVTMALLGHQSFVN